MIGCAIGLGINLTGAVEKFLNQNSQKMTVVHQSLSLSIEVPKLMICHQSQFSRTGIDFKILDKYSEDRRRQFYNFLDEKFSMNSTNLPNKEYFYSLIEKEQENEIENCETNFLDSLRSCDDDNSNVFKMFCSLFILPEKNEINNFSSFLKFKQTKVVLSLSVTLVRYFRTSVSRIL